MQPINLKEVKEGDSLSGLIYIQSYTKKPLNSISRAPVYGVAYYHGKTMPFKIWDAEYQRIFSSDEYDFTGGVIGVSATAGVYNGTLELTLNEIDFSPMGNTDIRLFFKSTDVEGNYAKFADFLQTHLSEKANNVFWGIVQKEDILGYFKFGWAAMRNHDAQFGGLLNHTLKMLRLAETLIQNDPRLKPWSDLIYLGIVFHDMGKVYEIDMRGSYTQHSFVTHRIFGVEMLSRNRDIIVSNLGVDFYYHLLAIVQQHHGEYGEKPTTVWSFVVHLIDMLEANITILMDKIENCDFVDRNGNKAVSINNYSLVI